MEATTPVKERVPLASLDANAISGVPKALADGARKPLNAAGSPVKDTPLRKRALAMAIATSAKRPCLGHDEDERERSLSPDTTASASSVFDSSAVESSWATAATDVDVDRVDVENLPQLSMTREQAREKAQILRLRLGLASYKVRTGQTDVALADLQLLPLPSNTTSFVSSSSARPARALISVDPPRRPRSEERMSTRERKDDEAPPSETRSRRASAGDSPGAVTPQRSRVDDGPSSSALRGGAASGLLSLARGRAAMAEED